MEQHSHCAVAGACAEPGAARDRIALPYAPDVGSDDIEIILDDGPWRAIVTFMSSDELREYLNECISAAVLAAWRRNVLIRYFDVC